MLDTLHLTDLDLGPLSTTIFLGFTIVALLSWHFYRKQTNWKKIGLPYGKVVPSYRRIFDLYKKPFKDIEMDMYKKYGRIYGYYELNKPAVSIAEPEILRKILVKDFHSFTTRRDFSFGDKMIAKMMTVSRGEDWKRIRTIVSPTFTTGKIKKMLSIFKESSQTLVQNFKVAAVKGEPVETKRLYGAFAMDIIASSAFSTKIDSHNDPDNPFVQAARKTFNTTLDWKILIFLIFPALLKIFKFTVFSKESMNFFTDVTLQIIKERKRTQQKRNDFLQLLLDTAKESPEDSIKILNEKDDIIENYGNEENDNEIFKQNIYAKKTLSHDEIIAQCLVFFLAGYDTTASTLSFTTYNLALNPDIQEKLIQEVDDALKENNGEVNYEAIQSMKYLDNVISETLRLYPPAIRLDRIADEEYRLTDIGLTIHKGMVVKVPVYAMHRDPKLYPDPEKFDPSRFTHEERAKRDQFAYLPFGHGPRNCVGMRFVLMEMKVCLAYILSNFRIKTCQHTKIPLEFNLGQGLLQAKDIYLTYELRTDVVN